MTDINALQQNLPQLQNEGLEWGVKLAWTAAVIVVGWICAGWVEKGIKSASLRFKNSDPMLAGFFSSLARWTVLVITGLAVLDRLGIQTTSIVTILGAAGLAVGLALQGTLSSLAAGIMLLLFRPFHVGQKVETAAISGTITSVSLFHTELVTDDNVQVIAPNSVLWGVTLKNTSHYSVRRGTIIVPVAFGGNLDKAQETIRTFLSQDERIVSSPAAEISLLKFNATDKVTDIEVHFWADQSVLGAAKSDLLAKIYRDVLST
jgi:small conductance mechanosensitive channel